MAAGGHRRTRPGRTETVFLRRLRLIPRDERFFDLFAQAAANNLAGAEALLDLLERCEDVEGKADRLKALEHRGDELTRQLLQALARTFVTPLDREDIGQLAAALDDVMDWTEEVARRLRIYRVRETTDLARRLGRVLVEQCRALQQAVPLLEDLRHRGAAIEAAAEAVHRLENEADDLAVAALGGLFDGAADVPALVERIRWGDLYETLEEATDKAATVADVLLNIHIKHA
jgi:predicted phosphate transport protein (TIGR00153 family)